MTTTFIQKYPSGTPVYTSSRRLSGASSNTERRLSAKSLIMNERRKSDAISEKATTIGGVRSLTQGKLPTNDQLHKVINRLQESRSIEANKYQMSEDGQILLQDFKELLQVFQEALRTKNRDELFQSMIYHIKKSVEAEQRDRSSQNMTSNNQNGDVKEEVKIGANAILKIAKLFLFNPQFRGLLDQIINIAQQALGVALQKGGETISEGSKGKDEVKDKSNKFKSGNNTGFAAAASRIDKHANKSEHRDCEATDAGFISHEKSHLNSTPIHENIYQQLDPEIPTEEGFARDIKYSVPQEYAGFLSNRFGEKEEFIIDDSGNAIPNDSKVDQNLYTSTGMNRESKEFSRGYSDPYDKALENKNSFLKPSQLYSDAYVSNNTKSTSVHSTIPIYANKNISGGDLKRRSFNDHVSNRNMSLSSHSDIPYDINDLHSGYSNNSQPVKELYKPLGVSNVKGGLGNGYQSRNTEVKSRDFGYQYSAHTPLSAYNHRNLNSIYSHSTANPYEKTTKDLQNELYSDVSYSRPRVSNVGLNKTTKSSDVNQHDKHNSNQVRFSQENEGSRLYDSQARNASLRNKVPHSTTIAGTGALSFDQCTDHIDESTLRNLRPSSYSHNSLQNKDSSNVNKGRSVHEQRNLSGYEDENYDSNEDSYDNESLSSSNIVNKEKEKAGVSSPKDDYNNEGEDSTLKDEVIKELKEIMTTIQKNKGYKEAISTLLSLFSTWGQRIRTGSGGMDRRLSSAVAAPEQSEYYKNVATFEAKTIIEDWAQGKSLDPILQQFYKLTKNLKQDKTVNGLVEEVIEYVKRLLKDPGYLSSDQSTKDGDRLVKQVRGSAVEKYRPDVRNILDKSQDIIKTISNDDISTKIAEKIKDIHNHLWHDSNGKTSFKPHLLNDMRLTLLPAMIEQIKYVPLPQILYGDKQYEIAIENMVLEGDTLMPENFEIKVDDYLNFSPYAKMVYNNSQTLHIKMSGIHTTMNNVIFYFKKKTGFPRMSDSGVISLATGGAGLRISMKVSSHSKDQKHIIKVDECHSFIDRLDIDVTSCKHNLMYKIFNPVMTNVIRRQICNAIERKLTETVESGDEKLTRYLRLKQNSRQNPNKPSKTTRPGLFSHLANTINQKMASRT